MSTEKNYTHFDVHNVTLSGSNLIEASAGTGKTYSIAILVLRLLLEKKIPITEILMVTFTKAAVAELEERIRKFLRSANRCANGEEIEDSLIKNLVHKAIENNNQEEVIRLLKLAVINLDEVSVLTIHSFCQQTLNEFAFETNQLFSAELVQDTSLIIEEELQKFWRKNITSIRLELLNILLEQGLSQNEIQGIVKEFLNGKVYYSFDKNEQYTFNLDKQNTFFEQIETTKEKAEKYLDEMIQYVNKNRDELAKKCESNNNARNGFLHLLDKPKYFIDEVRERSDKQYVQKLFSNILEMMEEYAKAKEAYELQIQGCKYYLYSFAIQEISKGVHQYKIFHNQLSFDDLISNLHQALVQRENPALETALRNKYKAVFIDEFQDTDKTQYEIFKKAFQGNSILFYIGDPKQSIYAWRKADIATYFKARNDVDFLYGMNINYRSTADLIEAMNQFFLPTDSFDTFYYGNADEKISYFPVEAPATDSKGFLVFNNEKVAPITFFEQRNKAAIAQNVADQTLDLLTNAAHGIVDGKTNIKKQIRPSDIGILVRSKKDGSDIKIALAHLGIPAVTVTDAKVLQSDEATQLLYVLEAILNNTRSKVNRALMSSFTNWSIEEILKLNEEKVIQQFREYKEKWNAHGVYAAMMDFISDFEVQQKLLERHTENGERIITNLFQLLEILYKTEHRQHLNSIELIDWLKRNIQNPDSSDDEAEQRIENDEDAVKIVTIHSSKGLQYNIVMAPSLDFVPNDQRNVLSFRDEESGVYKVAQRKQLTDAQLNNYLEQDEQENRRLLYVTITRAVYKCFIFKNTSSKSNNSTLSAFYKSLTFESLIQRGDPEYDHEGFFYIVPQKGKQEALVANHFHLTENNWIRMSYSLLAAKMEWQFKERYSGEKEGYDAFIFSELSRGTKTGNFLHFIFENIDFTKSENWTYPVKKAMKRFVPNASEPFEENILEMLQQVLNAKLQAGENSFKLSSIAPEFCIHELEFDFPVAAFTLETLSNLRTSGIAITDKIWGQIEGIMNGKIDLFFQHQGKYFVLDWKSTYLGPMIEDYNFESLTDAMEEHNYHLQYLIYTLAVKKYLKSRISNFDYDRDFGGVFYLFVRGMRYENGSGFLYFKPEISQINQLEKLFFNKNQP